MATESTTERLGPPGEGVGPEIASPTSEVGKPIWEFEKEIQEFGGGDGALKKSEGQGSENGFGGTAKSHGQAETVFDQWAAQFDMIMNLAEALHKQADEMLKAMKNGSSDMYLIAEKHGEKPLELLPKLEKEDIVAPDGTTKTVEHTSMGGSHKTDSKDEAAKFNDQKDNGIQRSSLLDLKARLPLTSSVVSDLIAFKAKEQVLLQGKQGID